MMRDRTLPNLFQQVTSYMERHFNIYSIIWRFLQIFEDNFKWIKDIFNSFEDIFKWFEDIFKSFEDIFKWIEDIFKWYYL